MNDEKMTAAVWSLAVIDLGLPAACLTGFDSPEVVEIRFLEAILIVPILGCVDIVRVL